MFFSKKLYKSCLSLIASIVATSIVGLPFVDNNIKNVNITKNIFNSANINKTIDIPGNIDVVEQRDHVEVNLSGYDIDLDKYKVNVDQTSETGIPLNNNFQINFEIVSNKKFKVYRTSLRKYYRLYIVDKSVVDTQNNRQYFQRVIKVDNFSGDGSSIPNKIYSSVSFDVDENNPDSLKKFTSFFIDKGIFKKEIGFDIEYLESMKTWDANKVYDEMNGTFFSVTSKNSFNNEFKNIGYSLNQNDKEDKETLFFWMELQEQYIFNNNENVYIISSEFKIERDSPPPIPPINGDTSNSQLNSSTTQTTIFAASISTALLFLIAIVLFVAINNKNKVKQRRNYDLEKAIKNRNK